MHYLQDVADKKLKSSSERWLNECKQKTAEYWIRDIDLIND